MTESSTLSEQEAHDLVGKLQAFSQTLSPREQQALASVISRGLGLAEDVEGYSFNRSLPLGTQVYIPEYFQKISIVFTPGSIYELNPQPIPPGFNT